MQATTHRISLSHQNANLTKRHNYHAEMCYKTTARRQILSREGTRRNQQHRIADPKARRAFPSYDHHLSNQICPLKQQAENQKLVHPTRALPQVPVRLQRPAQYKLGAKRPDFRYCLPTRVCFAHTDESCSSPLVVSTVI